MTTLAFFDDRHPSVYGSEENLLLLAEACRDVGHSVVFITTDEGVLANEARRRELDVIVCRAPGPLLRFEREPIAGLRNALLTVHAVIRYTYKLDRIVRTIRCDVLMVSAVRPALFLLRTGLGRRTKVVLYAQNSTPLGAFAAIATLISWRTCLIGRGALPTFPRWIRPIVQRRFRLLPSGRRLEQFTANTRRWPGSAVQILTVASITRRKGLDLLIRAAAQAADTADRSIRLVIVGGTTGGRSELYLRELQQMVSDLDVDAQFKGWQDHVVPEYHAADMFVLASYDEGLPGVLLEAMAAGLPCITTDAGSAGEVVSQCGAGIVVKRGDTAGIAAAISKLIADEDLWHELSTTGQNRVMDLYGLEAYRRSYEQILTGDACSKPGIRR